VLFLIIIHAELSSYVSQHRIRTSKEYACKGIMMWLELTGLSIKVGAFVLSIFITLRSKIVFRHSLTFISQAALPRSACCLTIAKKEDAFLKSVLLTGYLWGEFEQNMLGEMVCEVGQVRPSSTNYAPFNVK
jgi:hypothetical protein